jgi:hypothetical protein
MEAYTPNFKIKARDTKELAEISNMFVNMMNHMKHENLLQVARKINSDPEKKVKKMEGYRNFL